MVQTFQAAGGVNCLDLWERSTLMGVRAHLPSIVLSLECIPWPAWRLSVMFLRGIHFEDGKGLPIMQLCHRRCM